MNRRKFTKLLAAGAITTQVGALRADEDKNQAFKANFAPSPGQLATGPKDYIGQLQFAYDHGFRAWEDNWLMRQKPELWEKVGEFAKDKGMMMGIAVITLGHKMDFSNPTKEGLAKLEADMKKGVEMVKLTGQTCMTMIPGGRNDMERNEQIAKSVDTMKRCCDIVEDSGIILVQEPVSHKMLGQEPLLKSFADGHLLCAKVNRKSCKLLADFYHEGEIGNGDKLIENAEKVWDQVGYVQYGDSPGRKEPGTGKLDLGKVTQWLREKKYTGVIGMEHGVKGKGEQGLKDLIAAYRKIDA
ncbi:hypothetical protein NT6N_15760 [Oceaniferula spumae]|uniref:Xylose isomerase-like TIM barrel domain-containing protein n=1 Tax=Oceaniferula spumae TaxID=2979115 RepID=A0AAT9FKK5_9BACT